MKSITIPSACLLLGLTAVSGQFSDTFEDGNTSPWVANDSTLTEAVDNSFGGPGAGPDNEVLNVATDGAFDGTDLSFSQIALAIGETMTLSFDARFVSAPASNFGGFRFGIGEDVGGGDFAGYRAIVGTGTGGNFDIVAAATGSLVTSSGTNTGGDKGFGFGTTARTFSLIVERTGSDAGTVTLDVTGNTGGPVVATVASGFFDTFDSFGVATGSGVAEDFRIDNFSVVIPEPNSYGLLLGFMGAGLLALKRRR